MSDLLTVFRELYASEINCGIGRKAESVFYPDELDDAAQWLIGQACRIYPEFGKQCAQKGQQ